MEEAKDGRTSSVFIDSEFGDGILESTQKATSPHIHAFFFDRLCASKGYLQATWDT